MRTLNPFHKVLAPLRRLRRGQRGATSIEYGLIVAVISLAALVGIRSLGTKVELMYEDIRAQFVAT